MLQYRDSFLYPCTTALTIHNGKYYGNRFDGNGICSFDFEHELAHVEGIYDDIGTFAEWQFGSLIAVDDALYSIPLFADYIAVYSFEKKTIDKIILDKSKFISNKAKYDAGFLRGNEIWMSPKCCYYMAKFDVPTGSVTYYGGFEEILKSFKYESWPHFVKKTCYLDDMIYIILWESSNFIKFDIKNKKYHIINAFENNIIIKDCLVIGKQVVLYCTDGTIYCFEDDKIVNCCHIEEKDSDIGIVAVDDYIWLVNSNSGSIRTLKWGNPATEVLQVRGDYVYEDIHGGTLWFDGRSKVYILPERETRQVVVVDKDNFAAKKITVKISESDKRLYKILIKQEKMFHESKVSLDVFLRIKLGVVTR